MSRLSGFFDTDNPVMVMLNRIADMIWVSIVFLIACIPVITIGDAITSLYYVCAKVIRHGEGYVWKEFWYSFKINFKQSTICWVLLVFIYLLLGWNINYMGLNTSNKEGSIGFFSAFYMTVMVIVALMAVNLFPIISRFANKFTVTMKFALFCAFRHILHSALILAFVLSAGMLVYMQWATPMMFFGIVLPGVICYLCTYPMEHVLKKYQPKKELEYDEAGNPIRMWYDK